MIVGLDFDNTVIGYDEAIYRYAVGNGLCGCAVKKDKKAIRDAVRLLEDGEMKWRKLQAYIYGPGIGGGVLNRGAAGFAKKCVDQGIRVNIISHKTRFAASDETGTDLRESALSWMRTSGFLKDAGLSEKDVFFEDTRAEKIQRLICLKCTHFVDDLEETFHEPSFPENVVKILFSPHSGRTVRDGGIVTVRSFDEIGSYVF